MPRCARSTTLLVWGIPVHPTYLLRAIKTHKRLLPALRTLRGCHLFAPNPPLSAAYPPLVDPSSSGSVNKATPLAAVPRKGISSLPLEIIDLIEEEVRLGAHEDDLPRALVGAIGGRVLKEGQQHPNSPGWRGICVCGERYEETLDVLRCRQKVMAEVGGRETKKNLLKYFGLTTAVISMPLKHAIVLLVLPPRVSTLLAPLATAPSHPVHPQISKQVLATYPRNITGITGGRVRLCPCRLALPPPITPLVAPSDDFIGYLHPGRFSQSHWRLRNQNVGIRASIVDPEYLSLTEEMVTRVRLCIEELVLWKAVQIAREELGYEELACIEHFDVSLQAGAGQFKGLEGEEGEDNGHEKFLNSRSLEDEKGEGMGKRAEIEEDTKRQMDREREKNYWSAAVQPVLWLLEELTYEP